VASKVNVNNLTVVHAGSSGVAPSFPDVCLTPAPPAPPIPIPYPNIAQSSDAAQGSQTVTVEGNPVMIATSNFSTSTGDEAGSVGGVASGLTKGKAEFVNYSFDVKFDGKGVPRLGDPMVHNKGGAPNTPPAPEVQPPCVAIPTPIPGDPPPNELTEFKIRNTPGDAPPAKQPVPAGGPATNGALGVVVTADDAAAAKLAGAKVTVDGPTGLVGGTDANGIATFAELPSGAYTVTVEQPGFQTVAKPVTVTSGADASLTIALPPAKAGIAVGGVAEADKVTVGGLLVRRFDGNAAPRKKITLSLTSAGDTTNLLLQYAGDKIKIYDAANGGQEITIDGTANLFGTGTLPKDLWVEGVNQSDAMRDVELSAIVQGPGQKDTAKLTVLWVEQPTVALAGTMSATNAKRAGYGGWTKDGSFNLGLQQFNANFGARMGWGSEASAKVHPSGFNFPGNNLKLERDFYYRDYDGNVLADQGNHSAHLPPGNDTGPASARDDTPAPNDTIYDWDAAGLPIPVAPQNTIKRTRNNFQAFASITVEGTSVRCSPVRDYLIRFSQQQTAAPSGANWQIINPPDVAGDNQARHGTTNVTWDLK
jgi:hypothetical protein